MAVHQATVVLAPPKMDDHEESFTWKCICGTTGPSRFSHPDQAQKAGDSHAEAMNFQAEEDEYNECGHDRARKDDVECPDCHGELDPLEDVIEEEG